MSIIYLQSGNTHDLEDYTLVTHLYDQIRLTDCARCKRNLSVGECAYCMIDKIHAITEIPKEEILDYLWE